MGKVVFIFRRMHGEYYVSALIFHPTQPTWLFSGASDATITLWDIGIPKGENYETTHKYVLASNCILFVVYNTNLL